MPEIMAALSAFVIYQIDLLFFLFIVPFQVLVLAAGKSNIKFLKSVSVFLLFFVIQKIATKMTERSLAEAGMILIMLAGLYIVNFIFVSGRRILALYLFGAVSSIVLLPVLLNWFKSPEVNEAFITLVRAYNESLLESSQGGLDENSLYLYGEKFLKVVKFLFLSSFSIMLQSVILLNWYFGHSIDERIKKEKSMQLRLSNFRLPEWFIWTLFVPVTLILFISVLRNAGFMDEGGWFLFTIINLALVSAEIISIQGVAIILHRYLKGKRTSSNLIGLIILGFMIPAVNIVLMILLPGLGILENWITLRKTEGVKNDESNPL